MIDHRLPIVWLVTICFCAIRPVAAEDKAAATPAAATPAAASPAPPSTPIRALAIQIDSTGQNAAVTVLDPDVEITVLAGGRMLRVRDAKTSQSVEVDLTTMQVMPGGGSLGLGLTRDQFSVTRAGKEIVRVEPRGYAAPARPVRQPSPPIPRTGGPAPFEPRLLVAADCGVACAAFSSDGRFVAAGCEDGSVRICDANTSQEVRRFSGSNGAVGAVAFSPDGRFIASGQAGQPIVLRDAQSGEIIRRFTQQGPITAIAFSPQGDQMLSAALGPEVSLWEVASGKQIRAFRQPGDTVQWVAFSPDGRSALATGGYYGNSDTPTGALVRVWDLPSGKVLFELNPGVRTVLFNAFFLADGKSVLAMDMGGRNRPAVWDVATGAKQFEFPFPQSLARMALSADGRRALFATHDGMAHLYDMETRRLEVGFSTFGQSPEIVSLSRDGRTMLMGARRAGLWRYRLPQLPDAPKQSEAEARRMSHESVVYCAKFSPDGKRILSGGFDLTLRLPGPATLRLNSNAGARSRRAGSVTLLRTLFDFHEDSFARR